MRPSVIEALCLVAIGAMMVELHDRGRLAGPGAGGRTAQAAAKFAAAAGEVRSIETANGFQRKVTVDRVRARP